MLGKNPRSHHKVATGRVQNQLLPVQCHCQLGQDIPISMQSLSFDSWFVLLMHAALLDCWPQSPADEDEIQLCTSTGNDSSNFGLPSTAGPRLACAAASPRGTAPRKLEQPDLLLGAGQGQGSGCHWICCCSWDQGPGNSLSCWHSCSCSSLYWLEMQSPLIEQSFSLPDLCLHRNGTKPCSSQLGCPSPSWLAGRVS